jgi:predicted Zn-dependent protease
VVRIYCDIGKFADADRVLRKEALPHGPKTADTLFLEGIIALYGGKGSEGAPQAARCFEESLRLKPDNLGTRFRYGVCLARLDRPADAEREFRAVIKASATYAGAYKELAGVLRTQGKSGEAKQILARLQRLDDINQTIQYIENRRHLGNVPPEDLLELGSLYLETGKLTEAETALAEYVVAKPTDPHGHRKLAEVHQKMNLKRNAASDLQLAEALEARGGTVR